MDGLNGTLFFGRKWLHHPSSCFQSLLTSFHLHVSFISPSLFLSFSLSLPLHISVPPSANTKSLLSHQAQRMLSFSFSPWINYQRGSFASWKTLALAFVGDRNEGACAHWCVCVCPCCQCKDLWVCVITRCSVHLDWVGLSEVPIIRCDTHTHTQNNSSSSSWRLDLFQNVRACELGFV